MTSGISRSSIRIRAKKVNLWIGESVIKSTQKHPVELLMVGCRVVVGVIGAVKHAGVITFCKKPSFGFEIASVSSNFYGNSPKSRKMFSVHTKFGKVKGDTVCYLMQSHSLIHTTTLNANFNHRLNNVHVETKPLTEIPFELTVTNLEYKSR